MLLSTLALLAADQPQAPWWYQLLPFVFLFFMLYLVFIRPAQRQERERQMMIAAVKKNDKVLLSAGIYGTVVLVADREDEITVKVDDNTRIKVTKGSIARNITGEEAVRAARASAAQGVKAEDLTTAPTPTPTAVTKGK